MPVFLSLILKNFQGFSGTVSFQQTTGLIGKEATGKTAFFRALSIIRTLLLGYSIPEDFYELINEGTEISAEFKIGDYHFWYKVGLTQDTEHPGNTEWSGGLYSYPEDKPPQIRFERLECKWLGNKKRELIADAKTEDNIYQVFEPQTKQKLLLGHKRSGARRAAWVERQVDYKCGRSFLFSKFMLKKYEEAEAAKATFPTEGVLRLRDWAAKHWLILSSRPVKDSMLVKYCGSWHRIRKTKMEQTRYIEGTVLTEAEWTSLQENLIRVNELLMSCTGAILKVKSVLGDSAYREGFGSINDIVIEHHNGSISIDEASESLSTLAQLCWMLQECNVADNLVIIDDLDKNINDELLVSIVECFKKAKGQVVFTSLSSAPLRSLGWREAWFTQAYHWSANYVQTGPTSGLFNKYVSGNDGYYAELKDILTR